MTMDDGVLDEIAKKRFFILDENHNVRHAATAAEWIAFMEGLKDVDRRVGMDIIGDDICVSTVFLGVNYALHDDQVPAFFETMVFGGEHDSLCWRYPTWQLAEQGHKDVVSMVKGGNSSSAVQKRFLGRFVEIKKGT